jgi:hypothetical protein
MKLGKGGSGNGAITPKKAPPPPTLSNCLKIKNSRKFHIFKFAFFIFTVIYILGGFGRFVSVVLSRPFRFGHFDGFGRFVSVVLNCFDVSPLVHACP